MNVLFLALLLLVSCGKDSKGSNSGRLVEPLYGKDKSELIRLKYKDAIYLDCSIRVQRGKEIDMSMPPVSTFTWALVNELSDSRRLKFHINGVDYVILVHLAKPLKFYDVVSHVLTDGREYYMEFSPVLDIRYERMLSDEAGGINRQLKSELALIENVETEAYDSTVEYDQKTYSENFRCMLRTQIRPGYEDQWKQVK